MDEKERAIIPAAATAAPAGKNTSLYQSRSGEQTGGGKRRFSRVLKTVIEAAEAGGSPPDGTPPGRKTGENAQS